MHPYVWCHHKSLKRFAQYTSIKYSSLTNVKDYSVSCLQNSSDQAFGDVVDGAAMAAAFNRAFDGQFVSGATWSFIGDN
jgi:hypothetical protein